MGLLIAIIVWVCLSLLVGKFWQYKGKSYEKGIILSVILSPLIGFLIGALMDVDIKEREREKIESGTLKKCPACAELVKSEAILCRFCGQKFENESNNDSIIKNKNKEDDSEKELLLKQKEALSKGICPQCNNKIDSQLSKCFACGFDFPSDIAQ